MLRRILTAVLAALLLVLLSGCLKVEVDLEINEDETVSGTMLMAMDKEVLETLASLESSFGGQGDGAAGEVDLRKAWEEMQEEGDAAADLPPGATREPYEDEDYLGDKYTFEDAPLEEFQEHDFTLEHTDGKYVFTGDMDLGQGLSEGEDGAAEEFFSAEEMEQAFAMFGKPEMTLTLTFPGEVIETNGEVDGTTVTWDIDLTAEGSKTLTATAEDSGAGSGDSAVPSWAWAAIGGGALLLVASVVGLVLVLRRPSGT